MEGIDRKELGRLLSIGQVGLEMVVPIGIGVYLDNRFGWSPWATTTGAVLGLGTGLLHLVWYGKQDTAGDKEQPSPPQEEPR